MPPDLWCMCKLLCATRFFSGMKWNDVFDLVEVGVTD